MKWGNREKQAMTMAIRTGDLAELIDRIPEGVRYLSLDCFDTLVWRDCAMPVDVFADLPLPGGAIAARAAAESRARDARRMAEGKTEVSLADIHRRLCPDGDVETSIAREIAAEHRHCFGFRPVMDLIAAARARGLKVVIVSDTYLDEPQLRALIATACGPETADAIERVFVSSAYGVSKAGGLFPHVLEALGCTPSALFHLGDNETADRKAPEALGIPCAHLVQFEDEVQTRLRLEVAAGRMIDPALRVSAPAFQPWRPIFSLRPPAGPAHVLGHDTLGPVMAGFCRWLAGEARMIAARDGRAPKLLFMLRDGHLPSRVHRALFPEAEAATVEISRFTATAAGFTDRAAVRDYLNGQLDTGRSDIVLRQFLLTREEIARIAPRRTMTDRALLARLATDAMCDRVVRRSQRFAARLIAHLERAGVQEGDNVILVDLGYNGSVQNHVAPMLATRMKLNVAGRYLLLREKLPSGLDKAGFLGTRHYDFHALIALSESIAVVEQLCTVDQGSVMDYKPDGLPIRAAHATAAAQSAVREKVQAGCVAFAETLARWRGPASAANTADAERVAAAGALARLLFLPMPSEVATLAGFEHDVNLGSHENMELLDPDAAQAGLRRNGLLHFDESDRIFLPAEMRRGGVGLNLALFATRRFGLDLKGGDILGEPIRLPIMVADSRKPGIVNIDVDAYPTHDGFYTAAIPVGAGRLSIGMLWGRLYDWVEIEDARFHAVETYGRLATRGAGTPARLFHDGMENPAGGLYRCNGDAALTLAPATPAPDDGDLLLAVTFRPIAPRKAERVRLAA
ncbi:MAG: hydrolase [Sphingomonas bacterium]